MKKILLTCAVLLLAGAGCSAVTEDFSTSDLFDSQGESYPQLYADASLPVYPNSWITNKGKQHDSLEEGIKLKLRSIDPMESIIAFYELQMGQRGWVSPTDAPEDVEGFYVNKFINGPESVTFTIEDQGATVSISIVYKSE